MPASNGKASRIMNWVVLLMIAALYLSTMPSQIIVGDGCGEASLALSTNPEIRPYHLITSAYYSIIAQTIGRLGWSERAFVPMQIANIGLALLVLSMIGRILTRLGANSNVALCMMIILGLSNVFWLHATTAETGIHPCTLWTASLLFFIRHVVERSTLLRNHGLSLALCCLSCLFALNMVVVLAALVAAIYTDWYYHRYTSLFNLSALVVGVAALFLMVPFLVAARMVGIDTAQRFIHWMTSHPDNVRLASTLTLSYESPLRATAGLLIAFFRIEEGMTFVKLVLRGETLRGFSSWSYVSLSVALLTAISLASGFWRVRKSDFPKSLMWLLVFGIGLLFIFNTLWLGSDPQFWISTLPLLAILFAGPVSRATLSWSNGHYWLLYASVIVTMVAINLPRDLPCLLLPGGGSTFEKARVLANQMVQGDLLITPGSGWIGYVRPLKGDLRVVNLVYDKSSATGEAYIAEIDSLILRHLSSGHTVIVDGIVGPPFYDQFGDWQMIETRRKAPRERFQQSLARFHLDTIPNYGDGRLHRVSATR